MADESQPIAKGLLPHAAQSSESVPALNKVSAFALLGSHDVVANAHKITTNDATVATMPHDSEAPHLPEQNCPLFRLSTELRLEICRFAIQHALDLVNPPANTKYRYSTTQTTRGALALLYTCRTLRAESIDAMEPLAQASKSALQSEIRLIGSRYSADVEDGDDESEFLFWTIFEDEFNRLRASMTEINEVCSVLAFAREADEKTIAGEKMRRAREKITTENGQCVIWGSK